MELFEFCDWSLPGLVWCWQVLWSYLGLTFFSFQNDFSTTHCGHVFHTKCITDWFQHQRKNCPQCWNNQKKHQRGPSGTKVIELFFSKNGEKIQCDKYKLVIKAQKLEEELNKNKEERIKIVWDKVRSEMTTFFVNFKKYHNSKSDT